MNYQVSRTLRYTRDMAANERIISRWRLRSGVALLACMFHASVSAAGLGEITLRSYVGEPLQARIALTDVNPSDIPAVELGSELDYRALDISRPSALDAVTIGPPTRDAEGWHVSLRSSRAMSDLVLDLVIALVEPASRQTRHYPLLLDLAPVIRAAEVERDSAPTGGGTPTPLRLPDRSSSPGGSTPTYRPGSQTVTVSQGDSLYLIAQRLGDEDSADWLADALFQLNPDAFINGNRNQLLAGATLRLPENLDGGTAPRTDSTRTIPQFDDEAERLELRAPPAPEEVAEALGNWLNLTDSSLVERQGEVQRDISFARTEIETYRNQNEGLRDRIDALEARVGNMRRLLELRAAVQQAEQERAVAATQNQGTDQGFTGTPETAALTREVAEEAAANSPPTEDLALDTVDYGNWPWFPWVGGLAVAILVGLLIYLRSREEARNSRSLYDALNSSSSRSYLPDEL